MKIVKDVVYRPVNITRWSIVQFARNYQPMASKQWNLGKKEAMASTMQVNYAATHSKLLQDNVVNQKCRQKYCNVEVIRSYIKKYTADEETASSASRTLRSSEATFDFSERCLFCSQPAKLTGNKREHDVFPVRTLYFQTTLNRICEE